MTTTSPFVLTISNRKGGTGKTTTSVNIAAEAAQRGLRVLLVDLDTQGHSNLGFGVSVNKGQITAHDVFRNASPLGLLEKAIVPTTFNNLWLAPADHSFDGLDATQELNRLRQEIMQPEIASRFDLIVLDTPPSLDILLMNAMAAANAVLVPVLPHILSSEGVKQLIRLFFRIATSVNSDLKLMGFVPVMLNLRTLLHRDVMDSLAKQYGKERIFRGIRTDISLAEAFGKGQPIQLYDPHSRGAQDYRYLWEEMLDAWSALRQLQSKR
ncbi:MAG: ParA family protein [Thiotrichales bacterium]|jgi:chromosome partitioning protein|nr:ParA family protein [Thiotrichales bacterium]